MTTYARPDAVVWLMLGALALLWGGSFFFVAVAVPHVPPLTLAALRVGLAAAALWLWLVASGRARRRPAPVLLAFLGMGLLNNAIPFTLIFQGQTEIGAGLASILNATTPLFTVIAAHLLTPDERLTRLKAAGVATGFLGVVWLVGGAAASAAAEAPALAQLAVLGAAVSYACASLFGRRFRTFAVAPAETAAGQLAGSTLILAPLALLIDAPWTLPAPPGAALGAIAGLALASTALAYMLFFSILDRAGATVVSLVTFLIPPCAILLGWAFLGEAFGRREAVGLALIAIGLTLIDGRLFGRRK